MWFQAIVLIIAGFARGQNMLDAYVKIIDNIRAGELGIYRFTVQIQDASQIQTYLPPELAQTEQPEICRYYLFDTTETIETCFYDPVLNMVQFDLEPGFDGYAVYDIGQLRNPPYSTLLTSFTIQTLNAEGLIVASSLDFAVSLQIVPNELSDQSLEVGSNQIASQTTYLFQMTTSNPVEEFGHIQVIFPVTQIAVPDDDSNTKAEYQLPGKSSAWLAAPTVQTTYTYMTFKISSAITANTVIKLRLLNVDNPNTMAETESFEVQTLTPTFQVVDAVATGLTVICNEPAEISVTQVSVSRRNVGGISSHTYKLTLPTRYSLGGYLIVNLPPTLQVEETYFQCILLIGFNSDQGSCSLQSPSQIKLFDQINQKSLVFAISGIKNPPNTAPTQNFVFEAFDPSHNNIAKSADLPHYGFTPLPGQITQSVSQRTVTTVGQATSLSLQFSIQNRLADGEVVEVIVPTTHFQMPSEVSCQTALGSDELQDASCVMTQGDSDFTVLLTVECPTSGVCNAGTRFTLQVNGLVNIGWIYASVTDSVRITTMTADMVYLIDKVTSGVLTTPALVEGSFTEVSLTKEQGVVGDTTTFSASLTTQTQISAGGLIVLELKDETFQPPDSTLSCETLTGKKLSSCSFQTYANGYVSSITVPGLCSSGCLTGTTLEFKIANLKNPKSVKPINNSFTFRSYTALNQAIDKKVFTEATGLDVTPAQLTNVELRQPTETDEIMTGALQTYVVAIKPLNGIEPNNGKLKVNLPLQCDLVPTSQCSAVEEKSSASLTCKRSSTPNQFVVSHTSTSKNYAEATIVLTITNVKNPPSTAASSFGSAVSYLTSGGVDYEVDVMRETIRVQPNVPNTIAAVEVQRTVAIVNEQTELVFCITPHNPYPAKSQLNIFVPQETAEFGNSINAKDAKLVSNSGQNLQFETQTGVEGGEKFCFTLSGDITNPDTTMPSMETITIQVQTADGDQIEEKHNDIFASPYLSAGPFKSIDVQASGVVVGLKTEIEVTVQLKSDLPAQGHFVVLFPTSLFYLTQDDPQCRLESSNECFEIVTDEDQYGEYVQQVKIQTTRSYKENNFVTFTISNLANKYDVGTPASSKVVVQTQDQGYTINSSPFDLAIPYEPNTQGWLTVSRSNTVVQQATDINISLRLKTKLISGSKIVTMLPRFWFVQPQSVKVQINSQTVSASVSTFPDFFLIEISAPASGADSDFEISVSGFENRHSVDSSGDYVSIESRSKNGHKVDVVEATAFQDMLTPGTISVTGVSVDNMNVGAATVLSISFKVGGYPNAGDILTVRNLKESFYQIDYQNIKLNGKFVLFEGLPQQNTFWQGFSFAYPNDLDQKIFSVQVQGLQNLKRAEPLDLLFDLMVQSPTGGQVFAGQTPIEQLNVLSPVAFSSVALIRDSSVIKTFTQIEISFSVDSVPIIPSSMLQVSIPNEDLIMADGRCQTASSKYSCTITETEDNYTQLTIDKVCEKGCYAGEIVTLTVKSGLENPQIAQYTTRSSILVLTSEGHQIAYQQEGITVEPSLQTADLKITELALAESCNVAGQPNELELKFEIDKDDIPIATLIVTLPDDFMVYDSLNPPVCKMAIRTPVPCSVDKVSLSNSGEPSFALKLTVSGVSPQIKAGKVLQLKIANLLNTDRTTDRNKVKSVSLTLVSETNIILASKVAQTETTLQIATIPQPTFVRASTKTGDVRVDYMLEFYASNFIRDNGFLVIRIPVEQAIVEKRSLRCYETGKDQSVSCKSLTSNDPNYSEIEVKQWCRLITSTKQSLCPPTTLLRLTVQLTNPLQIQTSGLPCEVHVHLPDGETVAISEGFYSAPALDGISLINSSLQRSKNILGSKDETLVIFVGELSSSVYQATNLELTFPEGLAYQNKLQKPSCQRLDNGEVTTTCNVVHTYPDTQSIDQITIRDLCSVDNPCMSNSPIEVKILNLVNPTTNRVYEKGIITFSLKQESREIAYSAIQMSLPNMMAPSSDIQTKTPSTCTTLNECALNVTLVLQNPLKQGDYINFESKLDFMSQKCTVHNKLPITCYINSNNGLQLLASSNVEASQVLFTIEHTLMPVSTERVSSFEATSYELIDGRATTMELFSGGQVSVTSSNFKNVTMRRLNTIVNETTDIRVFIMSRQKARADYLQIQIPTQVAFLVNDYTACEQYNEPLDCQVASQTVIVRDFDVWCPNPEFGCFMLIKNARNPEFELYGPAQPVNVGLYQHGIDTKEDFLVHKSPVSIGPALESIDLQVSETAYWPSEPVTGQDLIFSFSFMTSINLGRFMIIEFHQDVKMFIPLLSDYLALNVEIDGIRAEIIDIQTLYEQKGLSSLTFKLPFDLQKNTKYSVVLTGITAFNVWLKSYESSVVTVYQMKSSIQEIASQIINVPIKIRPAAINPIVAYSDVPFVGQITSLVVSFLFSPSTDRDKLIELTIPDTYEAQNDTTCHDLQTQTKIPCLTKQKVLQVNLTEASLHRPQNGFTLQITQIKNPSSSGWSTFDLTAVDQFGYIYARGSFSIETSMQVPCPDALNTMCSSCTANAQCVQCKAGYVLQGNECKVICDEGHFELDGMCFKCSQECYLCQRQDMCSRCLPDQKYVAGSCLDQCPKHTVHVMDTNVCVATDQAPINCDSEASSEFHSYQRPPSDFCTQPLLSECTDSNCFRCTYNPSFCETCQVGKIKLDGKCVSVCPRGYFLYEQECFKCSPACRDCDTNANKCTSCRGDLLFTDGYNICVEECPTGTFTNAQHQNECAQCHDSCNSCLGESTNCTSCFRDFATQEDLYYSHGQCLQKCPFGTTKDLANHRCVEPESNAINWALPLAAVALVGVTLSTGFSHSRSGGRSYRFQVASGFLNLIDFVNRVALMCTLWPTAEMAAFVLTGFYVIACQVVGIYESKIVFLRERSHTMGMVASVVGPYHSRLLFGNMFGYYAGVQQASYATWEQFEACCQVQTWLTFLQVITSIVVFTRFGLDQVQFGFAAISFSFGVLQLLFQWVIRCQGGKKRLHTKLQ